MATTELSITATPGAIHTFLPKSPVSPGTGPHAGEFTELSAMATPGVPHSFLAKGAAPIPPEEEVPEEIFGGSGGREVSPHKLRLEMQERERQSFTDRLEREDRDLLEFIVTIVESGILE